MNIAFYSDVPQCGKSTSSDYLIKHYNFSKIMLAGPFKEMIKVLLESLNITDEMINRYIFGDLKETVIPELGKTPRYLMQTIGNEWGRDLIHPLIWCKAATARLKTGDFVIEDMRQANEYDFFVDYIKVKLIRANDFKATHSSDGQLWNHKFDYYIENNGDLGNLYKQLDLIVKNELRKEKEETYESN